MEGIKLYFFNHRYLITTICIILLGLIGLMYYLNDKKEPVKEVIEEEKEIVSNPNDEVVYLYVDIKGCVKNQGVYQIIAGSRVIDAIKVAGGLSSDADTSLINLSMKIKDEMAIVIYSKDEVKNFVKTKEEFNEKIDECMINNDICLEKIDDSNNSDLIDINKATLNELMKLPNIGESKAKAIISYRESNGLFKSIDEIVNVKGIGASLFEQIKDYIKV